MATNSKAKVLWLTNLPAPYRFPIWSRMAQDVDLKVAFLLKPKNWRNWTVPKNVNWKYQYLSLNSRKIGEFDLVPSFRGSRKILDQVNVVILGGWESPFYIRTLILAKRKKIPVIQFYESTVESHRFNNFIIRRIRKSFFNRADFIITPGISATKAVHGMDIESKKIVTLFNPVDVSWFNAFSLLQERDRKTGHKFLYVGQLIERKNVSGIIQAFISMRGNGDSLTIVGDGPLFQSLSSLAIELGAGESVCFVGQKNVEQTSLHYASHDTLILASTVEVWGLVVNEALASGMQAVVSNQCGVAEFVRKMNGVFICDSDFKSISESMELSKKNYNGQIIKPEILSYSPERFADEVTRIVYQIAL